MPETDFHCMYCWRRLPIDKLGRKVGGSRCQCEECMRKRDDTMASVKSRRRHNDAAKAPERSDGRT
jgi:hypothetical protein